MKRKNFFLIGLTLAMGLIISFSACKKDSDDDPDPVAPELAYVGSEACQTCHTDIYNKFIESGHPYKLNKIINNQQPSIPFTTDAGLIIPTPAGFGWGNITYIIGGYGWKVRFLDSKGYIMSENGDTQYNLEDGSQVAYHPGDAMGTLKYNCGRCHTTAWVSVADGGTPQDGLEGMDGQFFKGGVHCEQCHGMGSVHAFTQSASDITLDKSSDLCGSCHYRNEDHTIAASGGFIKHHEQYDEWLTSAHNTSNIGCNTCHDPHAGTKRDDQALGEGVKINCESCHPNKDASKHMALALSCVQCHMPKISKSAIANGAYVGDIKTHIFKINTSATGTMFSTDGTKANPNGDGMSLDYVCYQCHKDDNGEGGNNSQRSMTVLSNKATGFH